MFEKSIFFGALFSHGKKIPLNNEIQCLLPEFGKLSTMNVIQRVTEQRNNSRMHITHELIIRVCQSQVEYFSDFTGRLCCKLHKIVMQSI